MDGDYVIKVEGLSKKFCRSLKRSMLYGTIDVARNMVGLDYDRLSLRKGEFKALDNVSFELKRGEALGIIGQNGSGKTTLLRLLNGIYPPDSGRISIRGRMGALIAVGAGFHPHMTGRQNIYLNGIIIGMTRKEIDEKFEEIVAFADIGEFIDAPVSTYSSGMTVRLGFSIAIHSAPDILLADEVLAVGDLNFAFKCTRKIAEYRRDGGSLILVSHSMHLIRHVCDSAVWMEHGRIISSGSAADVSSYYERACAEKYFAKSEINCIGRIMNYDDQVHITNVASLDDENRPTNIFISGSPMRVRLQLDAKRAVVKPIVCVSLEDENGGITFECYSEKGLFDVLHGTINIDFVTKPMALRAGTYVMTVSLAEGELLNKIEWHERVYKLAIVNDRMLPINQGMLYPYPTWTVTG